MKKYNYPQKYLLPEAKTPGNRLFAGVILEISDGPDDDGIRYVIVLNRKAEKKEIYIKEKDYDPKKYYRGVPVLYVASKTSKIVDSRLKQDMFMFNQENLQEILMGAFNIATKDNSDRGVDWFTMIARNLSQLTVEEKRLYLKTFILGDTEEYGYFFFQNTYHSIY